MDGALALGDARGQPTAAVEADERERAIAHDDGPAAGPRRRRDRQDRGCWRGGWRGSPPTAPAPERVLVIGSTRADRAAAARAGRGAAARARSRSSGSAAGTRSASGCCASTPRPPASTPSSTSLGPAERLAMLLDRLDELPLRRHEIRGNPAGLLARCWPGSTLKADGRTDALEQRAREASGRRRGRRRRRASSSSPSSTPPTTGSSPSAGSLDRGDVFLALDCLLAERPDVRARRSPTASRT